MKDLTLSKTRLFEGVWEGVLTLEGKGTYSPDIEVTHLNEAVDNVEVIPAEKGSWVVRVPIPAQMISDGVQTFLINDKSEGQTLDSFTLMSGDALGYDIRAEVNLLREELDMLKRSYRRHCRETT